MSNRREHAAPSIHIFTTTTLTRTARSCICLSIETFTFYSPFFLFFLLWTTALLRNLFHGFCSFFDRNFDVPLRWFYFFRDGRARIARDLLMITLIRRSKPSRSTPAFFFFLFFVPRDLRPSEQLAVATPTAARTERANEVTRDTCQGRSRTAAWWTRARASTLSSGTFR